jgi:hypothetical protein
MTGGPPPLRPFGLVLHRDGSWTHEGVPITNVRLRAVFDRSVRYLPDEAKYVVQLGRFRGQIEIEEVGFFVRQVDLARGRVHVSDRSQDRLDLASLQRSTFDDALLVRIKRELEPAGLLARFTHAAQAELLQAVEPGDGGPGLLLQGVWQPLPELD